MTENSLNPELLRRFTPLDSLKRENIAALAKKIQRLHLEPGRTLFREGDNDRQVLYLLTGTLQLSNQAAETRTLQADMEEARNPIAPMLPRAWTARALGPVEFISIDSEILDVMLTWDQTGSYEVHDLNTTQTAPAPDDWMTTLLQTKAFHRVPPANIQAVFMRMQKVNCSAGEMVIKQGDEGDYFYAITRGRCSVTRETPLNKEGIKLAELGVGDTFGEEALISETRRNASVTMLTDGSLMRLGKDDFRTLLNEPMLEWTSYDEAAALVSQGARWLDVRLPSEFENYHLPDALNIPLYFIRLKLKNLDKDSHYIVCCDTGRRSSAGAYILNERGFHASVLKGGLAAADPAATGA